MDMVKSPIMSVKDIKELLLPVFERYGDQIVFSYLFGSMATGEVAPLSDIDVAVYLSSFNPEAVFDLKLSLRADICRALKRNDVDLIVLNTVVNDMLIEDIIRHGVVICDCDTDAREEYEVASLHQAIDFKTQRLAVMGA